MAGGVSPRVFKRFPRGMFLWVGKHKEEFPGHAIEVRGTPGRPNRGDTETEEKRHGGRIARAAVAEVEMETGLRVSRRGPRVRCRKTLAGKTCVRRNKPSSGGHSVWLPTALI